jgi:hypothetical protein
LKREWKQGEIQIITKFNVIWVCDNLKFKFYLFFKRLHYCSAYCYHDYLEFHALSIMILNFTLDSTKEFTFWMARFEIKIGGMQWNEDSKVKSLNGFL